MHLYLIRHGQSYVNLPNWTGTVDSNLTDLGKQQATALAAWLPTYLPQVDAIYSSTMRRPQETAEPVAAAYHLPVNLDHRLREIGNSQSNQEPYPEDQLPTVADWLSDLPTIQCSPFAPVSRAAHSETMMGFRLRVALFIEDILPRHANQRVLAFCHGGVIDAAFDYCFGVSPWRRCEVFTYNTGITHFQYVVRPDVSFWALHSHNLIEHLRDLEGALSF